jgi:uncharacterized membrane protein
MVSALPTKTAAASADASTAVERQEDLATEPASRAPDPTTARMRQAALTALWALIVLCLAWELWLAPTGSGTLALKAVPLMLCVVGLWRHRMYTYRWLSLLVWLYFAEGVVRATTETGASRWLAAGEVALSVTLFCISAFYIRWRLRRGRLLAEAQVFSPTEN